MPRLLVLPLALALVGCDAHLDNSPEPGLTPASPTTQDDLALVIDGTSYTIRWSRDGEPVPALDNRLVVPAGRTEKGQVWSASVAPRAFMNARGDVAPPGEVSVTIGNTPPVVVQVEVGPDAPESTDDLVATVIGDDVDGDELTPRYEWLRDGEVVDGLDGATVPADETSHGETWTVRAFVSDGEAESEEGLEASVTIANLVPVVSEVSLSPAQPREADVITASAEGEDPDGDALEWTYTWFVDEAAIPGVEGDRLTGAYFDKGQSIRVEAVASDGFGDGEPVSSDTIVAINTPPTATSARIEPGAGATEITVLTCVGAGFGDADPADTEGWLTTWSVRGSVVSEEPTLDGRYFDRDDLIECALRPFDGEEAGEVLVARPLLIENTPPELDSVTLDTYAPFEGDTVRAVLGEARDADSDAVAFRYVWTVSGSVVTGEGGPSLSSDDFDRGDTITVTVTPTDGTDDGVALTSPVATVQNTAPEITSVVLSPTSPRTADTITTSITASDADDDSISYTYRWFIDGALVSGATGASLPSSAFEKGDVISVEVTPTDGTDAGAAVTSASITAVNTPPELDSVSISPSTAYEASTLSCVPSGYADDDCDAATYTYTWRVNGSVASRASTLDGRAFDRGDSVTCAVVASDGTTSIPAVTSTSITIQNTAPVVGGVSLSTTSPRTNDTITASATGVSDADADAVTLTWQWRVNGSVVRTVSKASLRDTLDGSTSFDKKDTITVTVTPSDGTDTATAVTSATATALNTPPVLSIAISPSSPKTADALSVAISASDADGDTLSYLYAWQVNGSSAGSGSTLSGSAFSKGDDVDLTVTALDGDTSVTDSDSVSIANTVPTPPTVALTPSTAKITDTLTCTASGSTDADGDAITYRYTWIRNGSVYSTTTSTGAVTMSSSNTTAGDTWTCRADAYDGTGASASVTSASSSITNLDSCASYHDAGYTTSGTYTIYVGGSTYTVECDMTTAGGGWTVLVDRPSNIPSTSAFAGEWDQNPINSMGRYGIISTSGGTLRWAGGGSNALDFYDDIFWPNGGEIRATINYYGYSMEDSSVFFYVVDAGGTDRNVWCADGTTLGGSWPSAWSSTERSYMPSYTCPTRTGTGGGYTFRTNTTHVVDFGRTLDEFHFTSLHSDNGTGGDWSYLYNIRVLVR